MLTYVCVILIEKRRSYRSIGILYVATATLLITTKAIEKWPICLTFIKITVIKFKLHAGSHHWHVAMQNVFRISGWGGWGVAGGCTVPSMAHVISRQHGSQVNTHVMTTSSDLENTGCFESKPTISRLRFKSV